MTAGGHLRPVGEDETRCVAVDPNGPPFGTRGQCALLGGHEGPHERQGWVAAAGCVATVRWQTGRPAANSTT